jgi:hypothetical protein
MQLGLNRGRKVGFKAQLKEFQKNIIRIVASRLG